MTMTPDEIINILKLEPHKEGGHFCRTYQSPESRALEARNDNNPRHFSTAIYYLLQTGEFSAWHRLQSEEMWHHYEGDNIHIHTIDPVTHQLNTLILGKLNSGGLPQLIVPRGVWFSAELSGHDCGFALGGCTVTPGFDFADFEMPQRNELQKQFPEHAKIIAQLTHQ